MNDEKTHYALQYRTLRDNRFKDVYVWNTHEDDLRTIKEVKDLLSHYRKTQARFHWRAVQIQMTVKALNL